MEDYPCDLIRYGAYTASGFCLMFCRNFSIIAHIGMCADHPSLYTCTSSDHGKSTLADRYVYNIYIYIHDQVL